MMNLVSFVMAMVALTLYFIPTMVALARRHHNAMPIFLTNLYLGITFLGWVVSLIWAFSATTQTTLTTPVGTASFQRNSAGKKGVLSFLKYTVIAVFAVGAVLILIAFFMPAGTGTVNDTGAENGTPMSADDMFKPSVSGAK